METSLAALRITDASRSQIDVVFDGRRASLQGEAFLPGLGDLDFLIHRDQPRAWMCRGQVEPISEAERVALQNAVLSLLTVRGWRVGVDR